MTTTRVLLPHHRDQLAGSAISADVITERGYYSIETRKELKAAGGSETYTDHLPAIAIPIYNVVGELAYNVIRFDDPPIVEGRARKYLIPHRAHAVVDVPRPIVSVLGDPNVDLYVTEGSKKVDALLTAGVPAIGLIGVWSWRGTNHHGGKALLADLETIAFNGRTIHVIFDSDVMLKDGVRLALERFREVARRRSASVVLYYLPGNPDGSKVGVDDYLAGGGTIGELQRYATFELLNAPGTEPREIPQAPKVAAPPAGELIIEIRTFLERFVIWPSPEALLTVTLWVLHTWAFEAARATPYIVVVSPERRSGKSRVLEVVQTLVCKPRVAANISAAALYQLVARDRPTLLIDEIDAIFGHGKGDDSIQALRGVINAGNRPGFPVARGTQDMKAVDYEVYCPKLLAGINDGSLPDTIADRSIAIRMQRKTRDERVERWRPHKTAKTAEAIRDRAYAWAVEHQADLAEYEIDPDVIGDRLDDRAEDGWEPLFAIAQLAGLRDDAIAAAVRLAGDRVESVEDRAHALLVAVYHLLKQATDGRMHTREIIKKLVADEDAGFKEWRNGQGPSAYDLRSKLGGRYGIRSNTIRIDTAQRKGYDLADFADAWGRYGDPDPTIDPDDEADGTDGTDENRERGITTPSPTVAPVASGNGAFGTADEEHVIREFMAAFDAVEIDPKEID